MTEFFAKEPELDANWRAIVLFGANVASYKFALAKSLVEFAPRVGDLVRLDELAVPFTRHVCEHLRRTDKQSTSARSRFLDACRAFNRGELADDRLRETTTRLGFNNVIDAFHTVGGRSVPVRFFVDQRRGGGDAGGIRLTDELRSLAASIQGGALEGEVEARRRLVEAAWALDLPRAGVAVRADLGADLLYVERARRVDLTRVAPALNGYQHGRCFYCRAEVPAGRADVDHFFPWVLRERGMIPEADGVWNLVLACRACNRGEGGKFARVPSDRLVERLHGRNNWLVESHHPLRETIMLQAGASREQRTDFLRRMQRKAVDALIHRWEPPEAPDEVR
jgi:hypothetical protein